MSNLPLSLADYNRIHQVMHGVLLGMPEARADKACTFFASFGAYILNKEYGIPARMVGGAYGFCIGGPGEAAIFGKVENDRLASGPDAFHLWVQTKSHLIDFMAPIYREAFAEAQMVTELPRKMMQRPLDEESPSFEAFQRAGDYRYYPDLELTDQLFEHFCMRPINTDLIEIAIAWFGDRNAAQAPTFMMRDGKGRMTQLELATTIASDAW